MIPRPLLAVFILCAASSAIDPPAASSDVRFQTIDVLLDSPAPLAAWQVSVTVGTGDARIVGVEGGEAPFAEPPWYDPAALEAGRIVLGAFHTHATLPPGRHRVATLHLREAGPVPELAIRLDAAAAPGAAPVEVSASLARNKDGP